MKCTNKLCSKQKRNQQKQRWHSFVAREHHSLTTRAHPPPSPLRSSPLLSVLRHQTHSPRDRERERERDPQPHSIKSPPLSPRSKPPPPPPRRRRRPLRPIWCPRTRRWWSGNFVGRLLLDFLIFFFFSCANHATPPPLLIHPRGECRGIYHQIDLAFRFPKSLDWPPPPAACVALRCVVSFSDQRRCGGSLSRRRTSACRPGTPPWISTSRRQVRARFFLFFFPCDFFFGWWDFEVFFFCARWRFLQRKWRTAGPRRGACRCRTCASPRSPPSSSATTPGECHPFSHFFFWLWLFSQLTVWSACVWLVGLVQGRERAAREHLHRPRLRREHPRRR